MTPKENNAEIQRRFLLDATPENAAGAERIRQGYLVVAADRTEVWLRKKGKQCFLIVKRGEGTERSDTEVALNPRQFRALWPLTKGMRFRKIRYRIVHGDCTVEVDAFRRRHKGLVIAEIEFPSVDAASRFEAPHWLGKEITNDDRYRDRNLAQNGVPAKTATQRRKRPVPKG